MDSVSFLLLHSMQCLWYGRPLNPWRILARPPQTAEVMLGPSHQCKHHCRAHVTALTSLGSHSASLPGLYSIYSYYT